jgi:3-dehydroquinate dehydratase-1
MAMGPLGAVTRMVGGVFGSSLTFAVGAASSAPGQVPIEELNTVLAVLQKSMGSTRLHP